MNIMKFFGTMKFKIMLSMLCIALIPLLCLAALQSSQFSSFLQNNIEQQQTALAELNRNSLSDWIDSKADQLSNNLDAYPEFKEMDLDYIQSVLHHLEVNDSDVELASVVDKDGNIGVASINLKERDYFKAVAETKEYAVSDIIINAETGNKQIVVAVPVLDQDNNFNGLIASYVRLDALSDTVGKIEIADTGFGFLLSSNGDFIYHPDQDIIGENYSNVGMNEETLQAFEKEILSNDTGYVTYTDGHGDEKIAAFSTVAKSGWKIVVTAPTSEVYSEIQVMARSSALLILVAVLLVIVSAFFLANLLAKPITEVSKHLNILANADFTQAVPENLIKRKDEVGDLVHATKKMQDSLIDIIKSVSDATDQLSSNSEYLIQSASEVTEGSKQIATTMQELSLGAESQATSSGTISELMEGFVEKVTEASNSTLHMRNESQGIIEQTEKGQESMEQSIIQMEMVHQIVQDGVEKVRSLDQQANQISKLVEVIQGIAGQTNLLALNAAIEAARAGEHGKGFAVVANEVRKLAEEVTSSVGDITKIVTGIQKESNDVMNSLQNGYEVVEEGSKQITITGERFTGINQSVSTMVTMFQSISSHLAVIAKDSETMSQSFVEITSVSEESAAGIEQTAASSEQLLASMEEVTHSADQLARLAEDLLTKVNHFKI
ncbi:methyl-accepting chemotaxis sensory transducer [Alkaliphilus metalliredigens QYMF]|uniref:Methyl-accepting chemotaxis sensory transducer n=1 Tax=Alkaliphilus metalliredigens (strain QYMF) TaxID=293826 RepID=A6TUW6_ALKMQ|nr:methyl-accepting chemotaxis protein [Alkaliphilus metalliredigens]ABR49984.1 methyl-accepting chemotaxis sensory transducer [Alkaliphilus metalliredigens QYMF]